MKRFLLQRKGAFALLLALFLGMGTGYAYDFSEAYSGKTFYFNITDATNHYVEITFPGISYIDPWGGHTKPTGSLTLPSTISHDGTNYSVTAIGNYAFYECDGLTGSLTIPNSVTYVGKCAFAGCEGFTGSLAIGDSVTTIEFGGFGWCPNFTGTLTLGSSLTTIGDQAFYADEGFTGSITIPNSVTTIGSTAFKNCFGFTGSLTIGTSVASIGMGAFQSCIGITQVNYNAINCADVTEMYKPFENCGGTLTIGNTVQRIPANLFYQCTGLTGPLTIPNSVTEIGEGAFAYCDGFTGDLTIGKYVTSMGDNAFRDCTGFTHLNYNAIHSADLSSTDHENIPFKNFSGTLSIGDEVQRIPRCMFYDCVGLTGSLTIPSSVTSIGYGAFYRCTHFTSLYLGNSLTTIDVYAFYNCYRMTNALTIPESVTTIDYAAFADCYGFTSLTIGSNVTTIGNNAFSYCGGLGSITVRAETPPTLSTDGSFAFDDVPMDIPVYVPCGSISDYRAANGWSTFTNYQCIPWTVNLSANPWGGGYVDFTDSNGTNGHYSNGTTCTVLATPHDDYLFMHWSKNGTVVSSNPSYSFNVYEDTDLEAVFMALSDAGDIIGESTGTNVYLPSFSFYNYSLTEQIYTADELNGISTITSISFFNEGPTKTRTLSIYLMHTNKAAFSTTTDWISANLSNAAFGGSVTMRSGMWTTITLSRPFVYNGSSNLVLIVDDNTGDYSNSPHMACRTYAADGNQTLRIYSDDINYAPNNLSSYTGTFMQVKNQIMLNRVAYNIDATSADETAGTVSGGGQYGQGDLCSLKATPQMGYTFLDWTDETGLVISTEAEYSFFVTESRTLTAHFLFGTDVCSLTFDLYDSYGDGWNDNYLVADFGDGSSHRLTISSDTESQYSYTLPVVNGSHIELGWIQSNFANECFFKVSYSNGNIAFASVGVDLNANFEYGFDMDCDETPASWVFIGYDDNGGSNYLPSNSLYNYSLTQQIYSADEIGTEGYISSIAFYNEGGTKTRTYDIYMKAVGKYEFASGTNWISVTEDDKVFSGEVTMTKDKWTSITFDTPFDYDGTSNIVLVMDDNTGTWSNGMSCRTFDADGNQALYIYEDDIDYDPNNPSAYEGALLGEKNQIYLGIMPACPEPTNLTVTNITSNSAEVFWTGEQDSYNVRYRTVPDGSWIVKTSQLNSFMDGFEDGLDQWILIDADGDGRDWDFGQISGGSAHGGTKMAFSFSWYGGSALNPDNYLVTPCVNLGGTVTFWASAEDLNDAAEHFGIAVSTGSNTDPSDFTMVQEWTMTAKGGGQSGSRGNRAQGTWYQYTVDLSAYAGQTGYIALRHFNCTDQFALAVDDFSYDAGVIPSSIALMGLNPATNYEVQVQGICPYGLPEWSEPITFTTASTVVTQTIELAGGWNWISTYIDMNEVDGLTMLEQALGDNAEMIKSKTLVDEFDGEEWYRDDDMALTNEEMFMIYAVNACTVTLEGPVANLAEHQIAINPGWNWIGYPCAEEVAINVALSGFEPEDGDAIKCYNNIAEADGGEWYADGEEMETLKPGQGYMYYSNSTQPKTLIFSTTAKAKDVILGGKRKE